METPIILTSAIGPNHGLKNWTRIALVAAMILPGFLIVAAQTSKGTVTGIVRDPTGAVVPGAAVTATDQQTHLSRTTTSDGNGAYRFEGLDPDAYTIHVTKTGFNAIDSKDLTVVPSQTTSQDIALIVGSETQSITVTADSNAINTENAQLGGTVSTIEIAKLPTFSLSPFELATTVAGVSPVNQTLNLGGIGGNGFQIEVNGARPRANNFLLDGQDINDTGIGGQAFQPNQVDAYQSVAVLTNSSSAEYGRAGGAIVNTITKTGTNKFHGTVYDLYQGSGLNSQDGVTRKSKGAPKARFDQHTYGFEVGGPIIKDKLFAFGGTQLQRRYGNAQATSISVPDAQGFAVLQAIQGPQSQMLQQYLANGSYLTAYKQGLADVPIAISARPGCPNGCTITTAQFFRPPVPQQNPDTQWIVRVDFTPRSADSFFYRYLHDNTFLTPDLGTNSPGGGGSGLPGFDNTQGGPSELAFAGWTHVFTPTLLNELRAGETRIGFSFSPLPATVNGPLGKAFNLQFNTSVLPNLGVNQNLPQGRTEDLYQIQDTVGWTHGRQSLRIGVDLGRQLEKDLVSQNAFGLLAFNPGGAGVSDVDNFLNNNLGPNGAATKSFGPTRIDPHTYKIAVFAQDDIKSSPEFTFNLGLRYDFVSPPENGSLRFPAIDQNNPFAPIDSVFKVKSDKNNFGPRAGFAYAPRRGKFLNGDMVFHGGFGVFYDVDFTNIAVNNAQGAPNAPSSQAQDPNGIDNATGIIATFTPTLTPFDAVQSTSNRFVAPVTYQYNFGFERALPGQIKLTVNYVGNRSDKLFLNQQYNYRDPITRRRIHPDRGPIVARINDAIANYNSIQTEVSHRFGHGLFVSGNYVYGKALDDASEVFATFASPTSFSANLTPGTHISDYGNSVFDHRHFFSVAYVYSPVGFHSGNGFANALLSAVSRNFTLSGVTQLQSGSYSSFGLSGFDTNKDGSSFNDRPILSNPKASLNVIGIDGIFLPATVDQNGNLQRPGGIPGVYYNRAVFNTQVDGNGDPILQTIDPKTARFLIPRGGAEITPQEIGRNSFQNPGTTTWNFAVEKDLPINKLSHLEGSAFQFRVEAQDVFNHNDVGILNNNISQVGASSYLSPASARVNTNRNVRAWIKFAF